MKVSEIIKLFEVLINELLLVYLLLTVFTRFLFLRNGMFYILFLIRLINFQKKSINICLMRILGYLISLVRFFGQK